jgi:primosomal protein N' (replication factor Y)
MYISVKLLNGFKESLTYKIPDEWARKDLVGTLIQVPLQQRHEFAFVEKCFNHLESSVTYTIREAAAADLLPVDPHYLAFVTKLSSYYALDKLSFMRRLIRFMKEKEQASSFSPSEYTEALQMMTLTDEQESIVKTLAQKISQGVYYPSLLHGVTGSGKTEVYKKLIEHAWGEGKGTLLLFPEVSLAVQFTHLLKKHLSSSVLIYSFHSATSSSEKRALWSHLKAQKPAVILGVHQPVLLPLPHLGLIIIDEEHDTGYQEKRHPRIHTKEAALLRAQCASIPLLAGSATPSVSSLYNVQHKGWHLFTLKNRFAGSFPKIEVVKLTAQKPRKFFFVSTELENALKKQLEKKEQTIIFLNRRGYSFFIQCTSCGTVPHCINCDVSLTLHQDEILRCHYCSYSITAPTSCSACKTCSFLKKGIGTQQVVTILEKLFPQARIARADLDTTINKKKWIETIESFEAGDIDILVGTQTITKGYHFPKVTLVGILWADINLSIPMYNAAEITLQQLIQVAGRAGRQSAESTVIVQTFIDHPIFCYLNEQDYGEYYTYEIEKRREVMYPPCVRFAEIECKHIDESVVEDEARTIAQHLAKAATDQKKKIIILGPTTPPVGKIKKVYSQKIYVKGESIETIIRIYRTLKPTAYKSSLFFTPNPMS